MTESVKEEEERSRILLDAGNTYMSSALTIVASVMAKVRTQRQVRRRELTREARDSERIGERWPPPPARRPSAAQPILCHLKQRAETKKRQGVN